MHDATRGGNSCPGCLRGCAAHPTTSVPSPRIRINNTPPVAAPQLFVCPSRRPIALLGLGLGVLDKEISHYLLYLEKQNNLAYISLTWSNHRRRVGSVAEIGISQSETTPAQIRRRVRFSVLSHYTLPLQLEKGRSCPMTTMPMSMRLKSARCLHKLDCLLEDFCLESCFS
jgi:hypothetical protein